MVEEEHRKADEEERRHARVVGRDVNDHEAAGDDLDMIPVTSAQAMEEVAILKAISPKLPNDRRKWCSRLYSAILSMHHHTTYIFPR